MAWTEIYNKYKDTELMKEFENYQDEFERLDWQSIKSIFGWIQCFVETKGYKMHPNDTDFICIEKLCKKCGWIVVKETAVIPTEQAMNWCAEKFFEVAK